MNLKLFLIFQNFLVFISCIEVKLNIERNGTINNYTVIDNNNTKNDLFQAEKLYFSKCKCNFNNEIMYISSKYNLINFTINATDPSFNKTNEMHIEDPNLYINSKEIGAQYSLENTDKHIYKLQIQISCKNPNFSENNKNNSEKIIQNFKNKAIYKIESYSVKNHPEFNDNKYFTFLNFTFNYNKTLYYFSFVKICLYDELWKEILSSCCVMLIAFIYIYLSTYMKLNFKIFKEIEKMTDIKWYHTVLGVASGSGMLILIYFYKNYIFIILNILIGFESWILSYYTILFFVLEIGKILFTPKKYKELNKNKLKIFFGLNIYEIISTIISFIIIISYFITRHWILNNIICFCFSFTILSFLILRSFMICFLFLFLYFLYDTFWVFYSEKIFQENIMEVAATSIRIPIKIEFPILFSNNPSNNCMLLGLGDIILPGIVIKYCRRFDLIKNKLDSSFKGFSFYTYNLFLYFISVAIAMIMMFGFDHSQPVLFYISPIFIIGLVFKALYDKCFIDFWNGLKLKKRKKKNEEKKIIEEDKINTNNNNNSTNNNENGEKKEVEKDKEEEGENEEEEEKENEKENEKESINSENKEKMKND